MTNFAYAHIARWNAGQSQPELKNSNIMVVDYDQTKNAYEVTSSEMNAFIEWVSDNWGGDNADRKMNDDGEYLETAQQHLDRIDCCVCEL